jgi:hypothetical protein
MRKNLISFRFFDVLKRTTMPETKIDITDEKMSAEILKFTFIFTVSAILLIWYFKSSPPVTTTTQQTLKAVVSPTPAPAVTPPPVVTPAVTPTPSTPVQRRKRKPIEQTKPIPLDLYGSGQIVPRLLRQGINYYSGDNPVSAPVIQLQNTLSVSGTQKPVSSSDTTSLGLEEGTTSII